MEMWTEIDNCNLFNVFIMDIVDIIIFLVLAKSCGSVEEDGRLY